ncbi:glycoside hydrolase family 3 protein [Croceicoccus naphthovorans]|uniref:1,4-beta-D-glucan glucohydrolase n=1 Tax=Croceicoccus naphthovorans TaxID=1348774 RepID=A0A0G3XGN9_9SPHN|nr:glycoside hydrolase family 3 protein [Croceicoccus naphthovorans]AKM10372.1 1,4-beta-D-glucan glucohydrolase [Croceicoccus naphthovorans]MBB3990066.1 beta-glucosidase [Croceicoccus naphthovorans]
MATPVAAQTVTSDTPDAATANPANWPSARTPAAITDLATENRISALIARMTLEQRVGQLVQADISAISPEDLRTYPLGSILAGGNSGPYGNERATAADWDRLVGEFRAVSLEPREKGVAIPIIFGVDAVHGHNNIPGATVFPHNIGLGAAHDPALIRRIAEVTAVEIAGSGIEWTFAPTLAVPQDPRWGRTYEGYSSDPQIVARYGKEMVLGLQGKLEGGVQIPADRVAATAKHFLADGGTLGGDDQGDAQISERELIDIHAAGYVTAIDAGALTVMASFSSWNGVKNHGNHSLLTDALKGALGFQGFTVGDWNAHGQVPGCTNTDCPSAIMAGLDMFMAPDSWKGLYETTLAQARSGAITQARLNDAVRRILRVKFKLGLMDTPPMQRRDHAAVGAPAHLAVAREAVAKSLVLLKNEGSVLPIKPGAKVLVAGPAADSMAIQSGGWTVSWQGTDVTHDDFRNGQTIWDGLNSAVTQAGGSATLSADGSFDQTPDVAIVVFGETPYAEYQGDVPTLDYQPSNPSDLALLKSLKAKGIPVVSVFLSGRPMFTSPEINASDAFVAAWLPGSQGAGVADVLIAGADGKSPRDFTGTLSFPWPRDAKAPIGRPLFPLGYGQSYARPAQFGTLSEDPGMDMAEALNVASFFGAGRALAPWVLKVEDAGGRRDVASAPIESAGGLVSVRSVDVRAQEDAKALTWTGNGNALIEGPAADLSHQLAEGGSLAIEWRIDSVGSGPVTLGFAGRTVDMTERLKAAPKGEVSSLAIPLQCFADAGANLSQMDTPMFLSAGEGLSLALLSARIAPVVRTSDCPAFAD